MVFFHPRQKGGGGYSKFRPNPSYSLATHSYQCKNGSFRTPEDIPYDWPNGLESCRCRWSCLLRQCGFLPQPARHQAPLQDPITLSCPRLVAISQKLSTSSSQAMIIMWQRRCSIYQMPAITEDSWPCSCLPGWRAKKSLIGTIIRSGTLLRCRWLLTAKYDKFSTMLNLLGENLQAAAGV